MIMKLERMFDKFLPASMEIKSLQTKWIGTKLLLVIVFSLFASKLEAQPCREVIAYFPNWQWYDRDKVVNPASINYEKYTIINYSFFNPQANGDIQLTDPWADENLLQGEINWSTNPVSYYPNTSIIERAHNAGVKVLAAIGGWTLSNNFPALASDSLTRAHFASECNRLISFYGFDGIDIDWEYPGFEPHGGTAADKENFTLLMQAIRDSIDALGLQLGKTHLLTACFGVSEAHAANIEWGNLIDILDYFNIMSYDYFGTWDCKANHNAPLYAPAEGDPTFNLHATSSMLMNVYQVPPSKINLGVAFYGRSQTGASQLHASTNCNSDQIVFSADEGTPLYYNTLLKAHLFDSYWDSIAKVPYMLGKAGSDADGTFLSFDNEASIAYKAQYIIDNQMAGAIIWELTGDYIESSPGSGIISGTPLADTLNSVFCHTPVSIHSDNLSESSEALRIKLYPNPTQDNLNLSVWNKKTNKILVSITSIYGQVVFQEQLDTSGNEVNFNLSINQLAAGTYFLIVNNGLSIVYSKFAVTN